MRLRICLEAPEPSGQTLAYDTIRALGAELGRLAQLYLWPLDQRPVGPSGKPGDAAKMGTNRKATRMMGRLTRIAHASFRQSQPKTLSPIPGAGLPSLHTRFVEQCASE